MVIETLLNKAQEFLEKNEYEPAEKMLNEGYSFESWRDKFGPQILVGIAACQMFKNGAKDVKKVENLLH
jgi:hypothetical protein